MGDKRWGRNWLGLEREEVDFTGSLKDWNENTKNAGISGKGRACANTRKSHRTFTTQERTEQTRAHSKASGGTWWPFQDTGACGYNWKVLKTSWAHRAHPAGRLCRVGECCDSPLHFALPETSPSVPNNISLPPIALEYVPISSILSYSHWIYIFFNTLRIFIHVSHYDCILLIKLKLGS